MPKTIKFQRDNNWLLSRLDHIWSRYFADILQANPIFIRFGRNSKYRLGSIKLHQKTGKTFITITGIFKDRKVPQAVVDHTIAHELVHYAHGFSSKRVRMHKYPHAGGVVRKEIKQRGMENLSISYNKWIKQYRLKLSAHG